MADKVLRHLIVKALTPEYEVQRADADNNPGAISPSMIASILDADLIVADLSGHNPNVYYELAIAHGFRKATVHVQRVGEAIPFDVKDMRVVRYDITDADNMDEARAQLRKFAKFADENPGQMATPLSAGAEFQAVKSSTNPVAESNVLILDAIRGLRAEVHRLNGQRRRIAISRDRAIELAEKSADHRSMRKIIGRIAVDGRLTADDLRSTVTPSTSPVFDSWLKELLSSILGDTEDGVLEMYLYDNTEFAALEDDSENEPSQDA